MKRWLLFLGLLLAAPASSQDILVLTAPWVLPGATIDFDFVNGRYYQNGLVANINSVFAVTRAGAFFTDLLPTSPAGATFRTFAANTLRISSHSLGAIVETQRTNLFLNSTAPATQTTGTLANGTYNLWVNAEPGGSATMSAGTATGCGTGVATQGNSISFTTSGATGNCVVTIAGTVHAVELDVGAYPLSLIVTAGATVARPGEFVIQTAGQVFNIASAAQGTILCYLTKPHNPSFSTCFGASATGTDVFIRLNSGGTVWNTVSHAGVTLVGTAGTGGTSTTDKAAISWDGTGRIFVIDGGTPATDANTYAAPRADFGESAGARSADVPVQRIVFWPTKLTAAQLQYLTK